MKNTQYKQKLSIISQFIIFKTCIDSVSIHRVEVILSRKIK